MSSGLRFLRVQVLCGLAEGISVDPRPSVCAAGDRLGGCSVLCILGAPGAPILTAGVTSLPIEGSFWATVSFSGSPQKCTERKDFIGPNSLMGANVLTAKCGRGAGERCEAVTLLRGSTWPKPRVLEHPAVNLLFSTQI